MRRPCASLGFIARLFDLDLSIAERCLSFSWGVDPASGHLCLRLFMKTVVSSFRFCAMPPQQLRASIFMRVCLGRAVQKGGKILTLWLGHAKQASTHVQQGTLGIS